MKSCPPNTSSCRAARAALTVLPAAATSVRIDNIDCIVSAACRLSVMVKYPIERVVWVVGQWGNDQTTRYLQSRLPQGKEK